MNNKMMKIVQLAIVLLFMLAAVQFSHAAEENKPKKEKRFSNETNFALVNTTGNTEALTVAGKNEMKYKFTDKWTGSWVVGALYGKSPGHCAEMFTSQRRNPVLASGLRIDGGHKVIA